MAGKRAQTKWEYEYDQLGSLKQFDDSKLHYDRGVETRRKAKARGRRKLDKALGLSSWQAPMQPLSRWQSWFKILGEYAQAKYQVDAFLAAVATPVPWLTDRGTHTSDSGQRKSRQTPRSTRAPFVRPAPPGEPPHSLAWLIPNTPYYWSRLMGYIEEFAQNISGAYSTLNATPPPPVSGATPDSDPETGRSEHTYGSANALPTRSAASEAEPASAWPFPSALGAIAYRNVRSVIADEFGDEAEALGSDAALESDEARPKRNAPRPQSDRTPNHRRTYYVERSDHHHGKHHQSDTAQNRRRGDDHNVSSIMSEASTDAGNATEIVIKKIQKDGDDPYTPVDIVVVRSTNTLQEIRGTIHDSRTETLPRYRLNLYFSQARLTIGVHGHLHHDKQIILPLRNGKNFGIAATVDFIKDNLEKITHAFKHTLKARREDFGFDVYHTHGHFKYIYAGMSDGDYIGPDTNIPRAQDAIIYETHQNGELRRFLIGLEGALIHETPTDTNEFQSWMKESGKQIAFLNASSIPNNARFILSDCDSYNHRRDHAKSRPFRSGIRENLIGPALLDATKNVMDLFSRDNYVWELTNLALGLAIPFYDVLNALAHENPTQALKSLIIELVSKMGGPALKRIAGGVLNSLVGRRPMKSVTRWGMRGFNTWKNWYSTEKTFRDWLDDLKGP